MLYPSGTALEPDQIYDGVLSFEYEAPVRSENDLNIRTAGGKSGSLLMFRDSFGGLLYPYLADSFASAWFSRAAAYKLDLIAQREADCVVVELVERNIVYLLQNVPVMPAPLREGAGDSAPLSESVELVVDANQTVGECVLVQGTLPVTPDEGSRLYLSAADGWYEAFRLEADGFGLYVPEAALAGETALVCAVDGREVSLPII